MGVVKLKGLNEAKWIGVSKFAILREAEPTWEVELIADEKLIRNSVGYIGIENINDADPNSLYAIQYLGGMSSGQEFDLEVQLTGSRGEDMEGLPLSVGWNPDVNRFQERQLEGHEGDFAPQYKNPRHWNSRNCPAKP